MLSVGFDMGFDFDTFTEKKSLKQLKIEVFTVFNSKGMDKNRAKCNMGFGRMTKIYLI